MPTTHVWHNGTRGNEGSHTKHLELLGILSIYQLQQWGSYCFHLCLCVCVRARVSSWQNMVPQTPTVVGTTTEVVLST